MAMTRGPGSGYVQRSNSSGLVDVLDVLLDKGLVVDVFLRVSLVGIELAVDLREESFERAAEIAEKKYATNDWLTRW